MAVRDQLCTSTFCNPLSLATCHRVEIECWQLQLATVPGEHKLPYNSTSFLNGTSLAISRYRKFMKFIIGLIQLPQVIPKLQVNVRHKKGLQLGIISCMLCWPPLWR